MGSGLTRIRKKISSAFSYISSRYKVSAMYVFGSFSKGVENKKSDIDILVEFSQPVSLFTFLSLKNFLEELLGRKVDLVTRKAIRNDMRDKILAEAVKI
ncbi:MAG: nucleotidyltransferase family protein [Candidatus Anstonellales archaeon]